MAETFLPVQDHGGNAREACALFGVEEMLDFSASINPLGQPNGLRDHVLSRWEEVERYPDRRCDGFLDAVAAHHRVPKLQLVAGNGSAELIDLILRAYLPTRLLLSPPDFGLYRELAPAGLEVVEVPRLASLGYAPDCAALASGVRPGDLVLFSNPGNPSGQYTNPDHLGTLYEACSRNEAQLVVDEAFADFQPELTCMPMAAQHSRLGVLRSLTKFYGIPGLRLGFLLTSVGNAEAVRNLQTPWSVNALAQQAGSYCLADRGWTTRSIRAVAELRAELTAGLESIPGILPLDSAANYLLLELAHPAPPAHLLYGALAQHGILVRHCGSFGLGEKYLRVAVRTRAENLRLVTTLAELARNW